MVFGEDAGGKRWQMISLLSKGIEYVGDSLLFDESSLPDSRKPPFMPPRTVCEGSLVVEDVGLLAVACLRLGGIFEVILESR